MLKLHYKKLSFSILCILVVIGAIAFVYLNWIREPKLNIYHADYLDELDGGSYVSHKKTFIVEEPLFYRAKCAEIEKWVRDNQVILDKDSNPINEYEFLRYDEQISLKNSFLKHDYNAIMGDYRICNMRISNYQCLICRE